MNPSINNNDDHDAVLRYSQSYSSSCMHSRSDYSSSSLTSFVFLSAFRLGAPVVLKMGYRQVLRSDSNFSISFDKKNDTAPVASPKSALKTNDSSSRIKKSKQSVVFSASASTIYHLPHEEYTHSDVWWTAEEAYKIRMERRKTMRALRRNAECVALVEKIYHEEDDAWDR